MDAIVEYLKSIPKDLLLSIVYQLMVDGKLSYHELMDLHIQNMERMQKNLKEAIQLLKDEGRVNITQDRIDKYFKEK